MSPGGQLIQVSPNFVLNSGIATANAFHTYVSLAVSKSTAFSSHVAILTAVTDTAPSCPLGST